jgi:hypothetical protein
MEGQLQASTAYFVENPAIAPALLAQLAHLAAT